MPYQPDVGSVHLDTALTNFSTAYMEDLSDFVSDQVFPCVPVDKKSDKYFVFDKSTHMRRGGRVVPLGQEAPRGGFAVSNDNYNTELWRFAYDLTPDVKANSDTGVNIDKTASEFVMRGLIIEREIQWGASFFTTSVWATDKVGNTDFAYWDDPANSDPIADFANARVAMQKSTGYMPNTATMGLYVWEALKRHPLILDRYKFTSSDSITVDMVARLLEVDRVLIAKGSNITSQEGQSNTTDFVLGSHCLLTYSAPAPSLLCHSAGITFVWSGLTGLNNLGVATFRYPMPQLGVTASGTTERIEGQYAYGHKVTGSDLGYFFSQATSV